MDTEGMPEEAIRSIRGLVPTIDVFASISGNANPERMNFLARSDRPHRGVHSLPAEEAAELQPHRTAMK